MLILNAIVGALPARLQPYAKAVLPLVMAVVGALGEWAITGSLDVETLSAAVGAIAAASVTFLIPNRGKS